GQLPDDLIVYDPTEEGIDNPTDTVHGTAVAEVVYEMAPGAKLYLIKINDSIDLGNAVDYCLANRVQIINHSLGWVNTGWGDGTGPICELADHAFNNGILWVNSAGNEARQHYQGIFTNSSTNIFPDGDHVNVIGDLNFGDQVGLFLSWNDPWGSVSGNDYDLYLLKKNGANWDIITASVEDQSVYPYPTEAISGIISSSGTYGVMVKKYSGTDKKFQLFSFYQEFEDYVTNSSIMSPADALGAMAVGAVSYDKWATGPQEYYSSQGPTQDGRFKPDICGVDNNLNFTYDRFSGTSSASPCVAGAAALTWNALAFNATPDTVRDYLLETAKDMGVPGRDNIYGYGRVFLDNLEILSDIRIPADNVGLYNNLVNLSDPLQNVLRFAFRNDGEYTITVYNIGGEIIKRWTDTFRSYEKYDWDLKVNGKVLGSSIYFVRIKSEDFEKVAKFLVIQ
ncbi:MAG: S8 family peptidase, partial [Spirochaetes bacterium]|nr:S8 family peptidase [Spirochaetota bacterium]